MKVGPAARKALTGTQKTVIVTVKREEMWARLRSMNFIDWLAIAGTEKERNLHEFNAIFENDLESSCDEIRELRAAFSTFLSAVAVPSGDAPAAQLLREFCNLSRAGSDGFDCLPAFQGPKVSVGDREMSALKSFAGVEAILAKRPLLRPGMDKIRAWINLAPSFAPLAGSDAEKAAWQEAMDEWVNKLTSAAQKLESASPPSSTRRRLPPSGRVRTSGRPRSSSGSERLVLWLTFGVPLDEAMKVRNFFTRVGRPGPSPSARSFLAARRRYLSGLYYPAGDAKSDLEYFSRPPAATAYRVLLDVRMILDDKGKRRACQPTMFSKGDECLFVSAPPDPANGGRTVRLARINCGHVDQRCKCFKSGLHEVVVPQSAAEEAPDMRIAEVAIALGRHMAQYRGAGQPRSPSDPNLESLEVVRTQKLAERSGAA
jgi:hypothetical protein